MVCVPTLMHSVYSNGVSRESLLKVAHAVRYTAEVEAVLERGHGGAHK